MRELKFRAWDGENLVEKLSIGKMELFDDMLGFRFQHFDCDPEEVIFEQYTGLHDKNGREIYEGDIIQYDDETGFIRNLVFWDDKRAMYVISNGELWQIEDIEVVGNIHENPGLLK